LNKLFDERRNLCNLHGIAQPTPHDIETPLRALTVAAHREFQRVVMNQWTVLMDLTEDRCLVV
jgi:hypothetical protein